MIGREAFDSPEEHLQEMTGMSLEDATRFLEEHNNDPNAAAEAYFLSLDNATTTDTDTDIDLPNPATISSVDRLLQSTPTAQATHKERKSTLFSGGRRLNSPASSAQPAVDPTIPANNLPTRTLHVAFFKTSVVFFEAPPNKELKKRRRGVHTSKSFAGPYDHRPDMSPWINTMEEQGRVQESQPTYTAMMADMNNNRVPDLHFLRSSTATPSQLSFVLHDLRTFAAPPIVSAPASSTSSPTFHGAGNTLGAGSSSSSSRHQANPQSSTTTTTATATKAESSFNQQQKVTIASVVCGAVLFPLLCSFLLAWNVNLWYSMCGGVVGWGLLRVGTAVTTPAVVALEYVVVNEAAPTTTIKFLFVLSSSSFPYAWTTELNHTHTIQDLHLYVAATVFGRESVEYRSVFDTLWKERETVESETEQQQERKDDQGLVVGLTVGVGQRQQILNPFGADGGKSLKEGKLMQQRIGVAIDWRQVNGELGGMHKVEDAIREICKK